MSLQNTLEKERQPARPGQALLMQTLYGPSKRMPFRAVFFAILAVITAGRLPGLLEKSADTTMYYVLIMLAGAAASSYVWLTVTCVRYMIAVKRTPEGNQRSIENALILQGKLKQPALATVLLSVVFFLL